jgi:hypothetical protein
MRIFLLTLTNVYFEQYMSLWTGKEKENQGQVKEKGTFLSTNKYEQIKKKEKW